MGCWELHGSPPHKKTALLRDQLLEPINRIDTSTTVGLRDRDIGASKPCRGPRP
jgi:hypothetical protein